MPLPITIIYNLNQSIVNLNTPTSTQASWFYNPNVVVAIKIVLGVDLFQTHENTLGSLFDVFFVLVFFFVC